LAFDNVFAVFVSKVAVKKEKLRIFRKTAQNEGFFEKTIIYT